MSFSNDSGVDISQGPYLLLSNHVGTYDPIVISASMDRHVRWVAGAYLFKLGLLRLVLTKGATAIPKQQGRADMSSLKAMQNALKEGSIVGLFPEGTRTWDGDMVDLDYMSLAKMIRIFRCPVLFVHLEGVYGECPRWATERRKGGGMHIRITRVLEKEAIAAMSLPEFAENIKESMAFSNDEWKTKESYHYASPLRAEGLERVLYLCPKCGGVGTMSTKGSSISCSCGAQATLNALDDLESSSVSFRQIREWHQWEKKALADISSFPEEKGVLFQTGDADNNGRLTTVSEDITVSLVQCPLHQGQRFLPSLGAAALFHLILCHQCQADNGTLF
ncbi:MAG: 1-acyl-sn-glycerol-3-phosphate acyltransferase [Spirochaetales bacterium]|nr:1-acyl-sn-glycerol-3-phosphate acyltransferase [Candidatus Physcosoma equi]